MTTPYIRNPLSLPPSAYTKAPHVRGTIETLGIKPQIDIKMYVLEDDVTPRLQTVTKFNNQVLAASMKLAGENVKKNVLNAYLKAKREYQISPFTAELKGHGEALFQTGALQEAMEKATVVVEEKGTSVTVRVTWDIPEAYVSSGGSRKKSNYEYLWAHEYGALMHTKMKMDGRIVREDWILQARPFFINAIQNSEMTAARAAAVAYSPILEVISDRAMIKQQKFGVRLFPTMLSTTFTGFMAYFLPPAKFYAYIGAATDISGAFTGNLLSERQMFGWGRQYMWGQIGATRKTIRRKFRRKLWD